MIFSPVVALIGVAVEVIILIKVTLAVAWLFLFIVEPNILGKLSSNILEVCILCITPRFVALVYVVIFGRAACAANFNLLITRTDWLNADLFLNIIRTEQLLRFLDFDFSNFEKGIKVALNGKGEFNLAWLSHTCTLQMSPLTTLNTPHILSHAFSVPFFLVLRMRPHLKTAGLVVAYHIAVNAGVHIFHITLSRFVAYFVAFEA